MLAPQSRRHCPVRSADLCGPGRSAVVLLDGAEDQRRGTLSLLAELPRRGKPVIFVDRTVGTDSSCRVAVDDKLGSRLAVTHLLELGHHRIAFIGGPDTLNQVRDRRAGPGTRSRRPRQ